MSEPRFFPFNPRFTRFGLFAVAAGTTIALAAALAVRQPGSTVRAGLLGALLLAVGYVLFRLRPRSGWGVNLDERGFSVARPLSGESSHVRWHQVRSIERAGRRREVLVVRTHVGDQVLIPRQLFPDRRSFEALAAALEERTPAPSYDA